jgi:hypothetical protein
MEQDMEPELATPKRRWSHGRRVLTTLAIMTGAIVLRAGGAYLAAQAWIHSELPDGAVDATGIPYHANIRVGSDNTVMVVLAVAA